MISLHPPQSTSTTISVPSALLLLVSLLAVPPGATAQPGPAGEWEGKIEIPGSPLPVHLSLEAEGEGEWSGTYSIVVQGISNAPLEDVDVDDRVVSCALGGGIPGNPSFRLELSAEGTALSGTFTQGGATLPARFTRIGAAGPGGRSRSPEELEQDLQTFIDSVRTIWEIPGLAVAVVNRGRTITLASGVRSVESGRPVTAATQFPIGSTTKAFTATLLGTLVDEGLIEWDDRVVAHLPDFRLDSREATEALRVVDLLTHTAGLPRHDILWYLGTGLSRQEIFARLRHLESTDRPNQTWQYQNLMYMVAGILSERVTGQSWEELIEERIMEPLGMASGTTLDVEALRRMADHAVGHAAGEEGSTVIPFRSLTAIAPAGSINASATAMAAWLRFNLEGQGAGAEPLLTDETLEKIHAPHTVMPGASALPGKRYALYGLGWMISDYRGQAIVYHGGAIDGFVAQVTLMPEERIGVAVMTNRATGLPESLALDIVDMLRGEEPFDHAVTRAANMEEAEKLIETDEDAGGESIDRITGTTPSRPLAGYLGRYAHPAYDTVEVSERGGRLWVRYFTIDGRLDHYHYDVFELDSTAGTFAGTKVHFRGNLAGAIGSLAILLEPTIDPVEFTRLPDARLSDPAFLARFAGGWVVGGQAFTVQERLGRLLIDLPGQPIYELEPEGMSPDGSVTFTIEGLAGFRVRFAETDEGARAWFMQPNGTFPARRVE